MGGKQKIIRIYISNHSEWNVPDGWEVIAFVLFLLDVLAAICT